MVSTLEKETAPCRKGRFLLLMKRNLFKSIFCWGGRVAQWCWVNFQCRGGLLLRKIVGQGPTSLVAGAGGGCLDIFLSSVVSLFFLPLSGRRPDII